MPSGTSAVLPRARDLIRAAKRAPRSSMDVEGWRELLDAEATDERTFLGCFDIRQDPPEDAEDDWKSDTPFVFRAWQERMYETQKRIERIGRPCKLRMPKARGTGASSYSIAFYGFCRPLQRPGYRTLVVAQDQEESEEHMERLDDFYQQAFDNGPNEAALRALGVTLEVSSRRSRVIKFVDPATGQFIGRSKVRVKTARASGLGRGGGYDAVITTERPHWPEKCKKDLVGFLSRLTRSRWSAHIDESSPSGFDDFYEDCVAGLKKKGGYETFYIPAFARPENYLRLRTEEERVELKTSLGESNEHGGSDERVSFERCVGYWRSEGLDEAAAAEKSLAWVKFRREAIEGECRGSVENFHREHSTTLDEAFQGTGRPVLNMATLSTWMETAVLEETSWRRYSLEERAGGDVVAIENPRGFWRIRELPQAGRPSTYGADCAGAEERQAGSGKETDFSYCAVGDIYTGDVVAEIEEHIDPHLYAVELMKAAWYWRLTPHRRDKDAQFMRGLVEINNDMGGAVVTTMLMTEKHWGDGSDCIIETAFEVKTDTGMERRERLGWKTGQKTKEMLVTATRRHIDEVGRKDAPSNAARRCPWSLRMLRQMTKYVYKGKKMEAESGHDDGVVAGALMQTARRMLLDDGEVPMLTKIPAKKDGGDPFAAALKKQRDDAVKGKKMAVSPLGRAF